MENEMRTLEELHAHYKAVRARLDNPIKKEPPVRLIYPEPEPEPYPDPLSLPAIVQKLNEAIEVAIAAPPAVTETPSKKILSEVAEKYAMPPTVFRSKSRDAAYVLCRQEASYRLKYELNFSLSQIGRLMGHRDHTTVLHAIRRYEKNLALGQGPWASKSCVSSACVTQVEPQTQNDHG
jgi:chromosomal replication initiator protein